MCEPLHTIAQFMGARKAASTPSPIPGGPARGDWHLSPCTANGNFYIDAALGSDTTGDGSSGNPWTTLQYAYNWLQANVNFAGYQCYIHMADGIYTGGLVVAGSFIGANNAGSF
jgi:hypothetical protein